MRLKAQFYAKLGLSDLPEEDGDQAGSFMKRTGSGLSDKRPVLSTQAETKPNRSREDSIEENAMDQKLHQTLSSIISELKVRGGNLQGVLNILNKSELTKLEMQEMLSASWMDGWTAVHYASFYGKNVILKEFMDRGADVNIVTLDGWTPLLLSVNRKSIECVKCLLKSKYIQVNYPATRGTALHLAVRNGSLELVRLLLHAGADIHMKDSDGRCVYDYEMEQDMFMELEQLRSGGESLKVEEFEDPEEEKHMGHIQLAADHVKFRPPRPPLIRGKVYKFGGFFFRHFKRYLVLDAKEGTLIRYHSMDEYPLRPKYLNYMLVLNKIGRSSL